jgi:hypothetical protein
VLSATLSEVSATTIPARLVAATVKVAVLVAAGEFSAVSSSVGILMKGAFQTMLLAKLKLVVGAVMVVMALGASGLVYKASGQSTPGPKRPLSELEALRRENELLKLNLEVVLEKVRAQEGELRTLRGQVKTPANGHGVAFVDLDSDGVIDLFVVNQTRRDPLQEAEVALKTLREARDAEAQQKAGDALEKALQKLREQQNKQEGPAK